MAITIIAKNQTAGALTIETLSIPDQQIPASGQVTLTDFAPPAEIYENEEIIAFINSDDLLLNDGSSDLTKQESLDFVTSSNLLSDIENAGATGMVGSTGVLGNTGILGNTGVQGNDGTGPNTVSYDFSTTTTDSDPGDGIFRLNNATQDSATAAWIDTVDKPGNNVSNFWLSVALQNSTLQICQKNDASRFKIYSINTDAVQSGGSGGYIRLTSITLIDGGGDLQDTEECFLSVSNASTQGDTGISGNTGFVGTTGLVGNTGIANATGVQGGTGIEGVTGMSALTAPVTDNALIRGDGTDSIQTSGVILDDSDNMTQVNRMQIGEGNTLEGNYCLTIRGATGLSATDGIFLSCGENEGDIGFHVQDADGTLIFCEMHADDGQWVFGETYADTLANNGTVWGLDLQWTSGPQTDINTQNGGYRLQGELLIDNTGNIDTNVGTLSGTINGVRHYASSATDPVSPAPADGDRYYNTAISEEMRYDGGRSKWLSVATISDGGGRNGTNATNTFYRRYNGMVMTDTTGISVKKGTLIYVGHTRSDTDAATLEVRVGGSTIFTQASSATQVTDDTVNVDFDAGVMSFRNQTGGNSTSNVQITIMYKLRP